MRAFGSTANTADNGSILLVQIYQKNVSSLSNQTAIFSSFAFLAKSSASEKLQAEANIDYNSLKNEIILSVREALASPAAIEQRHRI